MQNQFTQTKTKIKTKVIVLTIGALAILAAAGFLALRRPYFSPPTGYGYGYYQPSITVLSPNGGEQWMIGKKYSITWTRQNVISCGIDLLKLDGSVYRHLVADNQTGSQLWTVPTNLLVGQYKIQVYCPKSGVSPTDPAYKEISDVSNNYFSIMMRSRGWWPWRR